MKYIMMVGIPGSGKSTYCKEVVWFINNQADKKIAWISRDEVRFSLLKDTDQYFSKEKEVYKEFINRIKKAAAEGNDVLIDATHLNHASRMKTVNALGLKPEDFTILWVNVPFEVCFERNAKREGITRVPDQQMYAMKNRFQRPAYYEGWAEIYVYDGKLVRKVTKK